MSDEVGGRWTGACNREMRNQEANVLPFNKRRGSEIEIQADEVEPVQLPPVRPPSVRPAAGVAPSRSTSSFPPAAMSSQHRLPPPSPPSVRPSAPPARPSARPSARPPISFRPPADDNERTLFVAEKQPRRTLDLRQPKVPNFDEPSVMVSSRDSFSDDEATRIHPNSSRSVLSMSAPVSSRRLPEDSSGRIRSDVPPPPPPPSTARVEEPRSAAAVDMSMTVGAGASQSQQVTSRNGKVSGPGRPTAVWAAALVAVGVFTGLAAALVARGGGDSVVTASAALIDPSQGNGAPQIIAQPQAAVANAAPVQNVAPVQNGNNGQGAVAQAVSQALQPAASCAADVTPTAKALVEPKVAAAPVAVAETKAPEPKVAAVVAPPPAPKPPVVAVKPVQQQPKVAAVAPPPAPKPAAAAPKPAGKSGSDAESAAAADALAKAQLEAALGR